MGHVVKVGKDLASFECLNVETIDLEKHHTHFAYILQSENIEKVGDKKNLRTKTTHQLHVCASQQLRLSSLFEVVMNFLSENV